MAVSNVPIPNTVTGAAWGSICRSSNAYVSCCLLMLTPRHTELILYDTKGLVLSYFIDAVSTISNLYDNVLLAVHTFRFIWFLYIYSSTIGYIQLAYRSLSTLSKENTQTIIALVRQKLRYWEYTHWIGSYVVYHLIHFLCRGYLIPDVTSLI